MIGRLGVSRVLWVLVAFLSFVASLTGVLNPDIYHRVVSVKYLAGTIGQDFMAIAASIVLLALALRVREDDVAKQIVALGLLSFLFYGYGVYSIERVYNVLYLLYMAIFGLAFYSLVFNVAAVRQEILVRVRVPNGVRKVAVGFLFFVPCLFVPLWISQLLPLMHNGHKIEFTYSIYVLDLCFVMPLFVMVGIMTAREQGLGLLFAPALFIKGFTVLFPLAVGEALKPVYKPLHGLVIDTGQGSFYLILASVFLVLAIVYLRSLRIDGSAD